MLVRRCCLTRPDDLVGLRGVEHVQFPRRHKPLEARIRRPLDRRHRPLRPAPATSGSRAERYRPHQTGRTPPPSQPWAGDPGASRNLVPNYPWRVLGLPWLHPYPPRPTTNHRRVSRRSSLWWPHRTCLAPRHPVVALARRLEIPASDQCLRSGALVRRRRPSGDDSYERLSAHCEAVLKFVRILLEAFPIAPVDTTVAPTVVQYRATGPCGPFRAYSGRPPSRGEEEEE